MGSSLSPPATSRPSTPSVLRRVMEKAGRVLAVASVILLPAHEALAQSGGRTQTIIRDAEIEALLSEYTRPILQTAGLGRQNVEVVLIGERSFNAFVADGRRIFINTGALMDAQTPNQIIGVLAHETGHIAGGHLARMREQIAGAQTMAIVAMLLAGAGAAAGAAAGAGGSNMGQAAAAGMSLPQEMARRSILSYQRGEEQAADRAAIRYLAATGQSAKGMLETFQRLQNDQLFMSQRIDPYLISHPMARERIGTLEQLARNSPHYNRKDSPSLQARHDLMRAKLVGFTERPETVNRKYPASDTSLAADYARAISAYLYGNIDRAVAQIDGLIARQPNNPYFYELKGQALLEGGRASQAVPPLRKAVELSNGAPLIRTMLGQALVQSGQGGGAAGLPGGSGSGGRSGGSNTQDAIRELILATQREPESPTAWRALAIAYGKRGDKPNADLASANAAWSSGDFETARQLAARARRDFPKGSPGWLKADDLLNLEPPVKRDSSARR